ncbi:hypothetical protein M3Y98_00037200 [Aphelenchoides besseyi]|nr:hypothetical protein M3Y98_00037200 [Aphelenchoides besseyi]
MPTKIDAEIRGAIQGDVKDLLALEKVADQVLAAKNDSKKYRLPFSFQSGEEMGMLLHPHIVFAACYEGVTKEQVGEVKRIVEEMQKRLPQLKKPIYGEATQKDQDRIKLKTEQIDNLFY